MATARAAGAAGTPLPSVDDLRLIVAVVDNGSVGLAAAELHIAQPSASARLAVLERRLGTRLFDRGPTGARATPAGLALAGHARRVLDLLAETSEAARAAARHSRLVVGTIPSLGPTVFAIVDEVLGDRVVVGQRTDHGAALVNAVADGAVDGAVIALYRDLAVPRRNRLHRLGTNTLVLLAPAGVPPPPERGRRPLAGREIVLSTYMRDPQRTADRLARRGATVRIVATAPTAVAIARRRRILAALPESATLVDHHDGDSVQPLGISVSVPLALVTARDADPLLLSVAPRLTSELHLATPS